MWQQGIVLALIGLGVGMAVSVGVSRALLRLFPGGPAGDGSTDVGAFVMVAGVVIAATMLAAYVPARRALRVDPMMALRNE